MDHSGEMEGKGKRVNHAAMGLTVELKTYLFIFSGNPIIFRNSNKLFRASG